MTHNEFRKLYPGVQPINNLASGGWHKGLISYLIYCHNIAMGKVPMFPIYYLQERKYEKLHIIVPKQRTIREHLETLPEPFRTQALKNMWWEDAENRYPDLKKALRNAFNWSRSPEKYQYWHVIYESIEL